MRIPEFAHLVAEGFAKAAHINQKYGDKPYSHHLYSVVDILKGYGEDRAHVLAAAWLHDVLEDTDVTVDQLYRNFDANIVELVEAVTDEPGATRKARKAATLPKIRANSDAVKIKLADRLANVRSSFAEESALLDMYRKEHAEFKEALYRKDEHEGLWGAIEAFLYGR